MFSTLAQNYYILVPVLLHNWTNICSSSPLLLQQNLLFARVISARKTSESLLREELSISLSQANVAKLGSPLQGSTRDCCCIQPQQFDHTQRLRHGFVWAQNFPEHTAALLTATSPQVEALGEVLLWKPFIFDFNLQANTNTEPLQNKCSLDAENQWRKIKNQQSSHIQPPKWNGLWSSQSLLRGEQNKFLSKDEL